MATPPRSTASSARRSDWHRRVPTAVVARTDGIPAVIEPIPDADEADVAEQARPVDDDIEECDALPDALGDNWNADASDLFYQKLSVSVQDDDHPR